MGTGRENRGKETEIIIIAKKFIYLLCYLVMETRYGEG